MLYERALQHRATRGGTGVMRAQTADSMGQYALRSTGTQPGSMERETFLVKKKGLHAI